MAKQYNNKMYSKCLSYLKALDANSNAKLGSLTSYDIETLFLMVHSDESVSADDSAAAIKHAMQEFGEVPSMTLYRGVSDNEKTSILRTSKSCLAHPLSFSEDKDIAKGFGSNLLTVICKKQKAFNISAFEIAYNIACRDFYKDNDMSYAEPLELNEQEWIIPENTKFEDIDRSKLEFRI